MKSIAVVRVNSRVIALADHQVFGKAALNKQPF